MATVTIEVTGTAAAEKIARLARLIGPAVLLKVIGQRLLSYVDESFKTRGRGAWKPLAWSTVAMRRHGGSAPLQDTGRYKQSFVKETDERTYVEVGTNLKTRDGASLGQIHEHGTGPYTIRPKNARVLAGKVGAGTGAFQIIQGRRRMGAGDYFIFGKEVHHPGVPARPVLPTKPTAERLVGEAVEEMLQTEAARGSH